MKKIYITIISLACLLCCAITLTACNGKHNPSETPTHTHNYLWKDNGDGTHKQHCYVSGCGEPDINCGNHDFTNGNCVCGKAKPIITTIGLEYILNQDGESYAVNGIGVATDTDIVIPSEYDGKPVTSISYSAFKDCASITSILIPDSVTFIGNSAFSDCISLAGINIPKHVTFINSMTFYNCEALQCIAIGNEVMAIGDLAFKGCSSLANATIGNKVITIGSSAFYGCSSLQSIVIPDNVTAIGNLAFYDCNSLQNITISNGITFIDNDTFKNCPIETAAVPAVACPHIKNPALKTVIITSGNTIDNEALKGCAELTSITIENTVTAIGDKAFQNCNSIPNVAIPDSVQTIGNYAFDGCDSLSRITVDVNNSNYASQDGILYNKAKTQFVHIPKAVYGKVVIPDGITAINGFANCCSLTEIIISNTVVSIGFGAFYNCEGLTDITIPDTLNSIEDDAFADCVKLSIIRFNGTEEQWNAVTKGYNWDYNAGNYTVTFTSTL